jgi:hypothetical protein
MKYWAFLTEGFSAVQVTVPERLRLCYQAIAFFLVGVAPVEL